MSFKSWANNKFREIRENNMQLWEKYGDAPDSVILRVFKSHRRSGDVFSAEFMIVAKIAQDRGLIDSELNML